MRKSILVFVLSIMFFCLLSCSGPYDQNPNLSGEDIPSNFNFETEGITSIVLADVAFNGGQHRDMSSGSVKVMVSTDVDGRTAPVAFLDPEGRYIVPVVSYGKCLADGIFMVSVREMYVSDTKPVLSENTGEIGYVPELELSSQMQSIFSENSILANFNTGKAALMSKYEYDEHGFPIRESATLFEIYTAIVDNGYLYSETYGSETAGLYRVDLDDLTKAYPLTNKEHFTVSDFSILFNDGIVVEGDTKGDGGVFILDRAAKKPPLKTLPKKEGENRLLSRNTLLVQGNLWNVYGNEYGGAKSFPTIDPLKWKDRDGNFQYLRYGIMDGFEMQDGTVVNADDIRNFTGDFFWIGDVYYYVKLDENGDLYLETYRDDKNLRIDMTQNGKKIPSLKKQAVNGLYADDGTPFSSVKFDTEHPEVKIILNGSKYDIKMLDGKVGLPTLGIGMARAVIEPDGTYWFKDYVSYSMGEECSYAKILRLVDIPGTDDTYVYAISETADGRHYLHTLVLHTDTSELEGIECTEVPEAVKIPDFVYSNTNSYLLKSEQKDEIWSSDETKVFWCDTDESMIYSYDFMTGETSSSYVEQGIANNGIVVSGNYFTMMLLEGMAGVGTYAFDCNDLSKAPVHLSSSQMNIVPLYQLKAVN